MDTKCYTCGAPVASDAAFCTSCGAPQIAVKAPQADDTSSVAPLPETRAPFGVSSLGAQQKIDWRTGLPIAAAMGLAAALVTIVPILSIGCCLWTLAAGFSTVILYGRRLPVRSPSTGHGAMLGAATGLFGSVFLTALIAIKLAITQFVQHRDVVAMLRQQAAQSPSPQAADAVRLLSTSDGLIAFAIVSVLAIFFAFIIFCVLGGILGVAIHPKRVP